MAVVTQYEGRALYQDQFGVDLIRDETAVRGEIDTWATNNGYVVDSATYEFRAVYSPMLGQEDLQVATELQVWLVRE